MSHATGSATGSAAARQQQSAASTESEAQFRGIFESGPDAMVVVNPQGIVVLSNLQTEHLFGYRREELQGRSIDMLLPERYRSWYAGHCTGYSAGLRAPPTAECREVYAIGKDGVEFPAEISLSPLQSEDGTLIIGAIRDITGRKHLQDALREKNAELEKTSQAKDHFLASMSHELRTPLNAILGFTGTLLMRLPGPLNTDQDRQLKTVRSSARHLLSLINDLLDLAKIESGRVALRLVPLVCQDVIAEVAESLLPLAQEKGLELIAEMPTEPVTLLTDQRALRQILINLASNAIKFTQHGSVRFSLKLNVSEEMPGPANTRKVEIKVTDTGIGIAGADLPGVFAPFTQVLTGGRQQMEGSGLGLHLSRKLAELLGGGIGVASLPGVGSVFTLHLQG